VKDFKGRVKRLKRRRLRGAKKCRKELFVSLKKRVGEFSIPPKHPAISRKREKVTPGSSITVGQIKLVTSSGSVASTTDYPYATFPKTKRIWDEKHPWIQTFDLYDNGYGVPTCREKRLRYREGGPLHIYTCEVPVVEIQHIGTYIGQDFRSFGGYARVYEGGFAPANWSHGFSELDFLNAGYSGLIGPDFESPASYGAEAYNRYAPKTQAFDAMQFLFDDIADLPGQLKTTSEAFHLGYDGFIRESYGPFGRGARARNEMSSLRFMAEQNLNYQFGWAPFIGDMIKLYDAYNSFNKRYAQVKRDNGHWIRRGGTVATAREVSEVTTVNGAGVVYPALTGDFYRDPANSVTTKLWTSVDRDIWFRGQFKYYIPGFHKDLNDLDQYELMMAAIRHYGLSINPSVVWELTPWTWLVDWFSNAGAVINNISRVMTDQLVSRDACIMGHAKHVAWNDSTIHLNSGDIHCLWYQTADTKKRLLANPYGFGLSYDDLSYRQLSILVSLGITHGSTRGLTGGPS
jgi:hypothetical protein